MEFASFKLPVWFDRLELGCAEHLVEVVPSAVVCHKVIVAVLLKSGGVLLVLEPKDRRELSEFARVDGVHAPSITCACC